MSYYKEAPNPGSRGSLEHLDGTHEYQGPGQSNLRDQYGAPAKRGVSPWIKFGLPVALIIVIGAVVGGVVGSRSHKASSSSSSGGGGAGPDGTELASIKTALGVLATTNSFSQPIYVSTTNTAAFTSPTFVSAASTWSQDPFQPASPAPTTVRTDRPRLIAPSYKWSQLAGFVSSDPYMKSWNDTIMADANKWQAMDPVPYVIDGGLGKSGVLDVARQVKMRIKTFAYAYRVTGQTSWVDRAWKELLNASGQGTTSFGTSPDNWNTAHFLDVAEFSAAFAIGYDWLYDVWTDTQKTAIRTAIINLGLKFGLQSYTQSTTFGWWQTVNGNWNCVCNSGLTMAALSIMGDDTLGIAEQILGYTIPNAKANCAFGPSSDGTWSETPNYWYFGTLAHSEMAASLLSATGSTYDLMTTNPTFAETGMFHMYVSGNQQMFDYGDAGPNKYSTSANGMFFHSSQFGKPEYMLFQRDRYDAPDPWSMFWYDPSVSGAFWDGMPLDQHFDDGLDRWASFRSSWTDNNGLYVAMKSGNHTGHQTHGDLDAGDFVLDAMGVRWAGELGSGDYDADGYFSSEAQNSVRWTFYRKATEGQNTLVLNQGNQNVNAATPGKFASTGEKQDGGSTVYTVPSGSAAYFTTDLTDTYFGTSIKRGIRTINTRTQVLLQDDITNAQSPIQWRMHTNATIALNGASATLTLEGKTMQVQILNAPSGVQFENLQPVPLVQTNVVNQPNPGVSVLAISLQPGSYNLQVLFTPQWPGMSASDFKTPGFVATDSWTTTSHP